MRLSLPIDVIVPAYNAAAFLRESLRSVAEQTCAVQEVIVIDDGSTDDTAAVARSLGARVVSQQNLGVAVARNAGIRASKAPFIALLDADDRWHPELLEAQWCAHERRPDLAIVATDYAFWSGKSITGSAIHAQRHFTSLLRERLSPEAYVVSREDMIAALAVRNFLLPSSMLLDRRLFDRDGVYYLPRTELVETKEAFIGEDYEWLLRALRVTDVAYVDRVLVDYRQSPGALSSSRGRMRYGDVVLARKIAASPARYGPGAAQAFARTVPLALRESAIKHINGGEFDLAAARLRDFAQLQAQPLRAIAKLGAQLLELGWMRSLWLPMNRLRRPRFR